MKNKKSQKERILKYLQSGRSITDLKALQKFDCRRLAARIYDLRKLKYKIKARDLKLKSGKIISEYKLIK